jgi:hypothetical protein
MSQVSLPQVMVLASAETNTNSSSNLSSTPMLVDIFTDRNPNIGKTLNFPNLAKLQSEGFRGCNRVGYTALCKEKSQLFWV